MKTRIKIYEQPLHKPIHLNLQWHITDRCNLRCKHCYQELYEGDEPGPDEFKSIIGQFTQLINGLNIKGHLTLTGGEPFLNGHFFSLLKLIGQHKNTLSYSILSNGTHISIQMLRELRNPKPSFIQLSVEGDESTHDAIRGNGNYHQVTESIRLLVKQGFPVMISFTAHQQNYKEFPAVAEMGRLLGVRKVWADRLIPSGSGAEKLSLTKEQTKEFVEIMHKTKHDKRYTRYSKTIISTHRALQFIPDKRNIYHCVAGDTLLTLMPNGDVYPCRRMPINVGNLYETSLKDLYFNAPLLKALRNKENISGDCSLCSFAKECRGGLRCLSFALKGDPFMKDPGCWV